jgi:hypothetical protein
VDGDDALRVKVYGRDARDTQLLRGSGEFSGTATPDRDCRSRLQQVEHEA